MGRQPIHYLLARKPAGQLATLERFAPDALAIQAIRCHRTSLADADTCETLRGLEANAALAYWEALADTPITFGKHDRVPEHWRTFASRASALTGNPRRATNPINAMLNYVYAILEAEASIACQKVGLDPALGVLHADAPNRDSLACDVMEAIRPAVDAFILDLLATRTFSAKDFHETREGVCRVLPPITQLLAATGQVWARMLAPIVEAVAQTVEDTALPEWNRPIGATSGKATKRILSTPLTQSNRSKGRDGHRRMPAKSSPTPTPMFPTHCTACGVPLADRERLYCDDCLPERQAENAAILSDAGPQALARLRAEGADPAHRGEASSKRRKHISLRRKEALAWEREHGKEHDPTIFTETILPAIRHVPVRSLVKATGLSLRTCSLVRRGMQIPHPCHWDKLAQIGSAYYAIH